MIKAALARELGGTAYGSTPWLPVHRDRDGQGHAEEVLDSMVQHHATSAGWESRGTLLRLRMAGVGAASFVHGTVLSWTAAW